MIDHGNYLRRLFRWAHMIWAILAGAVCVLLIVGGGGHPPPIIFVPVVGVVWVAGHIALWGVRRLAVAGKVRASNAQGEAPSWPPGLVIALIGTGAISFLGLLQLVISAVLSARYPFRGALWPMALTIWMAHAACFTGLLLRRPWSRWATAMFSAGWALLLAWQILEHVFRASRINPTELLIAIGLAALPTWLGYHMLTSERIQAFFGSR